MKHVEFAAATGYKSSLTLPRAPMLRQDIWKSIPNAEQLADPEDVFALAWRTHRAMSALGLSEKTVEQYTKGGLVIILDRHYDAGTDRYSDKILDRLVGERRLQYEQGQTTRALYQNLRKSAYWLREMHRTGSITVGRIPNWGQREPVEPFQTLLKRECRADYGKDLTQGSQKRRPPFPVRAGGSRIQHVIRHLPNKCEQMRYQFCFTLCRWAGFRNLLCTVVLAFSA